MTSCKAQRVPIDEGTKKRLFAESAGYCINPHCNLPLFPIDGTSIHFAELAHIIAATTHGPRDTPVESVSAEARSEFDNIILLCSNCHTLIDKDEQRYPTNTLIRWKLDHQSILKRVFGTKTYNNRTEARNSFVMYTRQNRSVFLLHGPGSPEAYILGNSHASAWTRYVLNTIIPNNRTLLRLVDTNRHLLIESEIEVVEQFRIHAQDLEARHLWNDWSPGGLRYPEKFDNVFLEV